MIRIFAILLQVAALFSSIQAQTIVSGQVTAPDGTTLAGVNVVIQGTNTGTITDIHGNYSISVPDDITSLVFSYIGFTSQVVEVGNQSVIDIQLSEDLTQLDEVVVTALGVERTARALQYSVTPVDGEQLTQARENNLANQLTGRVAGVNVSKTGAGAAGSTRVIIRGNTTLTGYNQPLYVVDGIPIDNTTFGQAGVWGGMDHGDGMTSISPDDIESINVLKGASAAALYGARAANGVINIMTKKGKRRQGIGVEFQTNYTIDKINDLSDLQHQYGHGNITRTAIDTTARKPANQTEAYQWGSDSWGPALDGSSVIQFDGVSRPYSYTGSNIDRFYQTGSTWTNSLAFSGGNSDQNFRISFTDLRSDGIVPNTGFDRTNVTANVNSRFGKRLTVGAKIMYSHEDTERGMRITDSPMNAIQAVLRTPPSLDVRNYYGDPNKPGAVPPNQDSASLSLWGKIPGDEYPMANNKWAQNPWWVAHQYLDGEIKDRIISSANMRIDITDFLWIQGRAGMDWFTWRKHSSWPQGTGNSPNGWIVEHESRVRETNVDWMLGYDDDQGPIGIHAFVGGNAMVRSRDRLELIGAGFNVPFFEAINNAAQQITKYEFKKSGINSLFGSAEISYNNYLYLTATVRNDWFSVLNPDFNSVFYPSLGLSWVFSDTWQMPDWLSFGKARVSYAQVGTAGGVLPYSTNLAYSLTQPHLNRPRASFASAHGRDGNIPNPTIKPLTSTEIEAGFDVRFLDNRLGFDFAYYRQKTTDDILNATIAWSTGFGTTTVNVGEMQNRGVEVLLTGRPVEKRITWDVSINFAYNKNEVISLLEGIDELVFEESRAQTSRIKAIVGEPYGVITGYVQKRDPEGNLVYTELGSPVRSATYEILGQGVPDLTGGVTNSLAWKGINLDFLVDFKSGASIHSGTNVRLTQWGLHKQTLAGRGPLPDGTQQPPVVVDGVTENDDDTYSPINRALTEEEAFYYWRDLANWAQESFTYDASFVKLRQLTLGYTLPRSVLGNTPLQSVQISFVGRNLAILWDNIENVDPESSYTNTNSQGLDYFGFPSTRSYGFNLRVVF